MSVLLDRPAKVFLQASFNSLPRKRVTKIRRISLATPKKLRVINVFKDVICDECEPCHAICFFIFTVTSIHNIHKITKIRNSETLNKMEDDTEDLKEGIQKKKLSDTCESNINTVVEGTCLIRKYSKLS